VHLNFADIAAPYYIRDNFKISILYENSLPYEACCAIYSPKNIVTVVIILKKRYEDDLRAWQGGDIQAAVIKSCCLRRELYCHKVCHLVAIIRAFPSDKASKARDDFIAKIKEKFKQSVDSVAKELKSTCMISMEQKGVSPLAF
jgi:hypothetical protein